MDEEEEDLREEEGDVIKMAVVLVNSEEVLDLKGVPFQELDQGMEIQTMSMAYPLVTCVIK